MAVGVHISTTYANTGFDVSHPLDLHEIPTDHISPRQYSPISSDTSSSSSNDYSAGMSQIKLEFPEIPVAMPNVDICSNISSWQMSHIPLEFCRNTLAAIDTIDFQILCSAKVSCRDNVLYVRPTIVTDEKISTEVDVIEEDIQNIQNLFKNTDWLNTILSATIPGSYLILEYY